MAILNYGGYLGRHLEFQRLSLLKRLSTQKLLLVI